ncbi:MAG: aminotransferase class V-fold PLP-dependent enzyme [Mediterranea massiliensis]|nr:aminotransferase class V-fold PLP-dependent enzyme [Mediterranea massiliensis]
MGKRIYLCLAHMSGKEQDFIQEAFDTNWVVPLGPNVNGFEKELENFLNAGMPVVALSAGTAAIHLALIQLGVQAGDEVICQSMTFCASCNPITYLGAKPVFVDSELDTWNMDPALMEVAIQDRMEKTGRKPKAIVPVHLYGMPAKMDEILAIANRYGIPVLEDAAEALGSEYKGRKCGTFGEFGALSFNGNKMITTSGGGALVVKDEEAKRQTMFYATQAREPFPHYQHEKIGYNYRMSNICAGIGRGQMTVLDEHIAHHRWVHSLYKEALKDVAGVELKCNPGEEFDSNYWLCTILIDPEKTGKTPEEVRVRLDEAGIETRPLWKPMHLQPVFNGIENGELRIENGELRNGEWRVVHWGDGVICQTSDKSVSYVNGVSEWLFERGLCIPAGPCVTDEDVAYIVKCLKEALM